MSKIDFIFPHIHHDYEWDVSDARSLWTLLALTNLVESPLRLDSRSNFSPGLVEAWSYSKDLTELNLKISSRYKFHDGTAVTPKDLVESLKRTVVQRKASHADLYEEVCDKNGNCNGIRDNGDGTITIDLHQPLSGLLTNFTTPEFSVVPPSYYEGSISSKKEGLKNLSGPYRLKEFTPKKMRLEAFPEHPLIDERSPKEVEITEITDINDAIKYYLHRPNSILIASDYSSAMKIKNLPGKPFFSAPALTEFLIPNRDLQSQLS